MRALHHYAFSLFFSGPLPSWLLLVLLPIVLAAAWFLYHREAVGLGPRKRAVLIGLRSFVLAFLVFCLFMPHLKVSRVSVYPGRIAVLVDNSLSMQAADSGMDLHEAARLGRSLGMIPCEDGDPATVLFRLKRELDGMAGALRILGRSASLDDGQTAPRPRGVSAGLIALKCRTLAKEIAMLPPEGLDARGQADCLLLKEKLSDLVERVEAMNGAWSDHRSAVNGICDEVDRYGRPLHELQAALDTARLNSGDDELAGACKELPARKRGELVSHVLRQALTATIPDPREQYLQIFTLLPEEPLLIKKPGFSGEIPTSPLKTDLGGRLAEIVAATNFFPLSAVILVSDGRDHYRGDYDTVLEPFVRKHVPVFTAAVGSPHEPVDLAIERVNGPAIGIVGREHKIEVHVKGIAPLPLKARLEILRGTESLSITEVTISHAHDVFYLPVKPEETGLHTLDVRLEAEGEDIFREINNHCDYAFEARTDPVRVLLLDDVPRWQTRFALNILGRLPYVELNSVIRSVDRKHQLRRGSEDGAWPDSPEDLARYDLIIIGDIERNLLGERDWSMLREAVEKEGAALLFLATRPLSLAGRFDAAAAVLGTRLRDPLIGSQSLALCDTGRYHPLTRLFADRIPAWDKPEVPAVFVPLLRRSGDGSPLLSYAFAGKGKLLVLSSERLWQGLNPHVLDAHSEIFMRLVEWACKKRVAAVFAERAVLAVEDYLQILGDGRPVSLHTPAGRNITLSADRTLSTASAGKRALYRILDSGAYRIEGEGGYSETVLACRDNDETALLSLNSEHLQRIARQTDGVCLPFDEIGRLMERIEPKQNRNVVRSEYRIWNLHLSLVLIVLLLATEWIVRKIWNRV